MIGILIVSHSAKVAEGVKEIAAQMGSTQQVIVAVGGTENGGIGTDPMRIMSGIEEADQGEGVVVLADLGSAVMSVGLAKEMLDPELAERVFLANAPIVEGAVTAVIEAAISNDIKEIIKSAEAAKTMNKSM